MPKRYWLLKSEPAVFGIDRLAAEPGARSAWTGVRNYQARNFMRDDMRIGDRAFFYHSSCARPGIAGIVEVTREAFPDPTQFDPSSEYFDPGASVERPRWLCVEVRLVRKTRPIGLEELRTHPELAGMGVLRRGNRLSIQPVDAAEWRFLCERLAAAEPA
ncbi:MAG: EVE domain-containing protein [Rhodocyclales bacterium CG17_big_fil_post_rev_8_21_14_2_50_68_7]|nr:MAG: EVE domain-containing protein [Betaproteobacteria bacterium CG2_30_68_42]PIV73844.1 MAG: EVE domain-containing protein [Rhodocyclales bacterium CG17_big_fil_post_rev_8_21_14_2_50_68_7]PIX75680.1 MAG: EVE domain-containing protein [Rhodocyclales bacterium CG_4_10_14_3_um_filter_68_10]PJA56480.1 MAG: EVE domain-containing protein [Rhodocyclales bacterium CG_4_9_14_3_um_filter_68_10]